MRTLAVMGLILGVAPASAGTLLVTSTGDSGPGTLRDQIAAAAPAGDEIQFDLPLPNVILLTSGELLIEKSLTISGPGADLLTVSGGGTSRVIRIQEEQVPLAVTITGLTIANGLQAVLDHGTGAGILNQRADLTLSGCALIDNVAIGGSFKGLALSAFGGGLWTNAGTVTVTDTTFARNRVTGADGSTSVQGGAARGGAIAIEGDTSDVTLVNVTISENVAEGGDGFPNGFGVGAGVNLGAGVLRIEHATIAGNTATDGAVTPPPSIAEAPATFPTTGGVNMLAGQLELSRTLVVTNSHNGVPSDVFALPGGFTSLGYNIVGIGPGVAGLPTDDFNNGTDPGLYPLADNGGPTETRAIDETSPAFDAIPQGDCTEAADQRGVARPQGAGCDIGAFELEVAVSEIPTLSTFALAAFFLLLAAASTIALRRRAGSQRAPASR